jgi:hypothetical protein
MLRLFRHRLPELSRSSGLLGCPHAPDYSHRRDDTLFKLEPTQNLLFINQLSESMEKTIRSSSKDLKDDADLVRWFKLRSKAPRRSKEPSQAK